MSEHPLPASVATTLEQGLASMGLDAALAPPLLRYLALLHRWNGTYNLTAIRDPQEMVTRHLLDSLAMQPFVADGSLADLGTGPGLPGIPLAIACPGLQVTLVESNGKKARFMREAVRQLGLDNARVAESRAEALDEPGRYDQLTARAMDTLAGIVRVGGHLLRPGGVLLAMKGVYPHEEIADLPAGLAGARGDPAERARPGLRTPPGYRYRPLIPGASPLWNNGLAIHDFRKGPVVRIMTGPSTRRRGTPAWPASSPSPTRRVASARPRPPSTWPLPWPTHPSACCWSTWIRRATRPWAVAWTNASWPPPPVTCCWARTVPPTCACRPPRGTTCCPATST